MEAHTQLLPPEPPWRDIPYSMAIAASVQAQLDGQPFFDIEVLVTDGTTWVRVTPTQMRPNGANNKMWHFDGTCMALDSRSQPQGPQGTCNGWVSLVPNTNAVAGKFRTALPL